MLTEICAQLRNYFLTDYLNPEQYIHHGNFVVEDGAIQDLPFLQDGQYFRVIGSVFNDGVWQYRPTGEAPAMTDEAFTGTIWAMRVPPDVIALSAELDALDAKAKADVESDNGFTSESFGGYSYTRRNGLSEAAVARRTAIWNALYRYRRLSVL